MRNGLVETFKMINTHQKGKKYELKVKDVYLDKGYAVIKGAGSKWFNKLNDAKEKILWGK